jgi:very-short-patch-repair endonuclease
VSILLIAAFAVIAAVVVWTIMRMSIGTAMEPERYPFEQTRPLSDREQVLYWRLRKVLPDQMVLAQVAVSRILRVEKGHDFRAWLNRINRMTVDFLVCLPDGTVVAAVELDDPSHDIDERLLADAKKTKALSSAAIKLLRFREMPSEQELRKAFLE